MARSRRRFAPLQSDKHEITWSFLAQDASAQQSITFVDVVQPASKNTAVENGIGSKIKWIYIEMNISAEVITNPKVFHWTVEAFDSGSTVGASNTYYQENRSNVLKRGMEMLPKDLGTVFKRIFIVPIPPKWQRCRNNMGLSLRYIVSSAEAINMCGFAIYKELY